MATDSDYASVKSLLHFDGGDGSTAFLDKKGKLWTAVGGAKLSATRSKFGGTSLHSNPKSTRPDNGY